MSADFVFKLVDPRTGTFVYADPYQLSKIDEDEQNYRVFAGETPDAAGEYQEDGTGIEDPRIVSWQGVINAADPTTLRDYWDTFVAAHQGGTPVRFYKHSDRFIEGHLTGFRQQEYNALPQIEWKIGLRCGDPFWNSDDLFSSSLTVNGTAQVTAGGNRRARPVTSLTFTAPGTAQVRVAGTGQSMTVVARQAGTYTLDSLAGIAGQPGAALRGTTDVYTDLYEQFVELPSSQTAVTVNVSGGGTVTAASMQWRKRYGGA